MHDELDKIDMIKSRTGVSYRKAQKALDEAGGDVVKALINLEEKDQEFTEKMQNHTHEIFNNIKGMLHKGQQTRIKIKQGERTVFEMPASVGAAGLVAALASSELAVLGALGTATAMAKKYTLEFEHQEKGRKGKGTAPVEKDKDKDTFTFKSPTELDN